MDSDHFLEGVKSELSRLSLEISQPRTRFPLNSKRLTASHLKRIAAAMGLPTTASADELRQMIEGEVQSRGREPRNVQVIVSGVGADSTLELCDAEGAFLEVEQEEPLEYGSGSGEDSRSGAEEGEGEQLGTLRRELVGANQAVAALKVENEALKKTVEEEKARLKEVWQVNCECLAEHDEVIAAKDAEIERLKRKLWACGVGRGLQARDSGSDQELSVSGLSTPAEVVPVEATPEVTPEVRRNKTRRGKAPPVDSYTGEDPAILLDDWLPILERAAKWNEWTQEELLLQLAGHLRGQALLEWSLLGDEVKKTYPLAIEALRGRLDPSSRALAGQDFRHISQGEEEKVADFIRRLERTFKVAYGRDQMADEARSTLLHGQLQDGLKYEIMRSLAISGALTYKEVCLAARNEEKRLAELKKRQQYSKKNVPAPQSEGKRSFKPQASDAKPRTQNTFNPVRRCYICNRTGHLAWECRSRSTESRGRVDGKKNSSSRAHQVKSTTSQPPERKVAAGAKPISQAQQVHSTQPPEKKVKFKQDCSSELLDVLLSSSDESESGANTRLVCVQDLGSRPQCVRVDVQGVPAEGIIDSGADITIMGGELFRRVAAVAKLRKRDLMNPDKIPRNYDQRPFKLDGKMKLDITFDGKTMCTPVYIKIDAQEQLLLSEGVCRQLGIICYHPDVKPRGKKRKEPSIPETGSKKQEDSATIPSVRVNLIQSVRILPRESVSVSVQVCGEPSEEPFLMERDSDMEQCLGVQVSESLMQPDSEQRACVVLTNPLGFTQMVEGGTTLGEACKVTVVEPLAEEILRPTSEDGDAETCRRVTSDEEVADRQRRLLEMIGKPAILDEQQCQQLHEFLAEQHEAFSLDPGERGETDLLQFGIDTGDATPTRQPPRRMPFVVRQEVARQLKNMQEEGVISPSSSPWASPVVLVRKKDGSHRFCVDYRNLNAVTKRDRYPLPRVDDLLDQMQKSQYFTTLDLSSGYWQIRVHEKSREKTAFVTPQGQFEFLVMPFGLANAPSVFQRLMQKALAGLNPEGGPDFVSVYIDDIIIFSETLEDHLRHLKMVIERLQQCGLKLKPVKCHFCREEVEYLGHIITRHGLKTNPALVAAVREFPVPKNVQEVRRFLGMTSYYRRFIPLFSKVAQALHVLTRQNVKFHWDEECQRAFEALKRKLVEAPVLAYPSFTKDFMLETDASIEGLGAVLSQMQQDGYQHPIAFASRALSPSERNYRITELETLAVVWALSHFHYYLYNQCVTVYTDHSAVKAVLETPNPTAKHARWWMKVYGQGVRELKINYRPGKMNKNADALSRSPHEPAPLAVAEDDGEVQISLISESAEQTIESLLEAEDIVAVSATLGEEQRKETELKEITDFLEKGDLPADQQRAQRVAMQGPLLFLSTGFCTSWTPDREAASVQCYPGNFTDR